VIAPAGVERLLRARVVHVEDGGTLDVVTDPGLPEAALLRCRLSGVLVPEPDDPDPAMREVAGHARDFVEVLVLGKEIAVRCTGEHDADGRSLAVIHWRDAEGTWSNLNADLVENGLAAWSVEGDGLSVELAGVPGRGADGRSD